MGGLKKAFSEEQTSAKLKVRSSELLGKDICCLVSQANFGFSLVRCANQV